jgi:hypothetical protein
MVRAIELAGIHHGGEGGFAATAVFLANEIMEPATAQIAGGVTECLLPDGIGAQEPAFAIKDGVKVEADVEEGVEVLGGLLRAVISRVTPWSSTSPVSEWRWNWETTSTQTEEPSLQGISPTSVKEEAAAGSPAAKAEARRAMTARASTSSSGVRLSEGEARRCSSAE